MMNRILDERDRSEITQEMRAKDELLHQKMEVEDNLIKETMKEEDDAIKATIQAEDNKIYNKIKNEDDAIKATMAKEDQALDDKIQDLALDTASQIEDLDNTKVDKDGDKVLSENDLTDELKGNYDASYAHSQEAHAPSNAEMNVQANWTEQDITSDAYIQNKPTLGTLAAKNIVDKSDLSAAVQASLELADTSIQAENLVLRSSDGYIQYSTDGGITWNNLMSVVELTGFSLHVDDSGVLYLG